MIDPPNQGTGKSMEAIHSELLDALPARAESPAEGLVARGWWSAPDVVPSDLATDLRHDLQALVEADRLRRGGIGRERDFQVEASIRRDRISWLTRDRPVQRRFLDQMEAMRLDLNRALFLGLFEFECHYAVYPPGGFYRRHYDSFRGAANRIVSLVAYLNPEWQPGDGGELVLYADDSSRPLTRIEPRHGTLAIFLSEEIPHEVLPATKDRYSIAGWFRLNASIGGQVDPAR